ncbi:MAG: hypothetical protein GY913_03375 [Proteobacteria bacterium]|nr:hypothetical protein [Pseudomonadota bacterium]MCP4915941.1 hypothetical protein [Pseudomonadota bacterium]
MRHWLVAAGLLIGTVVAAETLDTGGPPADTGDTGDSGGDSDPESAVFGGDTGFAGPDRETGESGGETGDTGDAWTCADRGLWVGNITFTSEEALLDWADEYNAVNGTIRLYGLDGVTDLSSLECLHSVKGTLELDRLSDLTSAELPALTEVGSLRVVGNPNLASLSVPELRTVGTQIDVEGNGLLAELDLSSLASARGLQVTGNPSLTRLSAPVTTLPDGLTLARNKRLARLDLALVDVGPLTIQEMGALTSLDGVSVVRASDVVLTDLPRLKSLGGLGSLTLVEGTLLIRDVGAPTLNGLVRLTRVEGDLSLRELQVTSLDGLEALSRVEGTIRLEHCPKLTTLRGLTLADMPDLTMKATPMLTDLTILDDVRSVGAVRDARFEVTGI